MSEQWDCRVVDWTPESWRGCTASSTGMAWQTARRCSCRTTRASSTGRGTSSPTRPAADPRYIVRLAVDGGFNGIALQIGLAEKFYWDYAGEVPLILKLNGKTDIPSDEEALSPLHATRGGRGPARRGRGRLHPVRRYAGAGGGLRAVPPGPGRRPRLGMPLIVWAYPRGSAIEAKGGKDSFYAVDYAARIASELGADMVKVNFPHPEKRDRRATAVRAEFTQPAGDRRGGPVRQPDAGARLRRREGRRRRDAREGSAVDGGRCDRADLRPKRLAARATTNPCASSASCGRSSPSTRVRDLVLRVLRHADCPVAVVPLIRTPGGASTAPSVVC